jgi:DNA-binding transcriptional regulator YhcF (GntR family)
MRANPVYRYEELAGYISTLVDNGTLRPGGRIPSLREIGRRRHARRESR